MSRAKKSDLLNSKKRRAGRRMKKYDYVVYVIKQVEEKMRNALSQGVRDHTQEKLLSSTPWHGHELCWGFAEYVVPPQSSNLKASSAKVVPGSLCGCATLFPERCLLLIILCRLQNELSSRAFSSIKKKYEKLSSQALSSSSADWKSILLMSDRLRGEGTITRLWEHSHDLCSQQVIIPCCVCWFTVVDEKFLRRKGNFNPGFGLWQVGIGYLASKWTLLATKCKSQSSQRNVSDMLKAARKEFEWSQLSSRAKRIQALHKLLHSLRRKRHKPSKAILL